MANLSNINNVLRVSSNLRVGINTDAASYALEIGGTNSGIKLKNSGASGKVYSLLSDTSGNFQIYDDAAASGRLVINSAGNATFAGNVTAPELRLQGTGTTYLNIGNNTTGSASSDGASIGYFTGQSSLQIVQRENDAMVFSTNGDERMRIDSSGNLGIGTDSPDTKLMVSGEILSENSNGGYFVSTRVPSSSSRPTLNFYGSALDINYVTGYAGGGASTAMTILSGGNVGIGVTDPSAKLDVFRTINITSDNDTGYVNSALILNSTESNSRGAGVFMHNTNDDQEWYTGVPYAANFDKWMIAHKSTASHTDSTSEQANALLTVLFGGNVGIGTTSPSSKFQVEGAPANGVYLSYLYNSATHNSANGLNVQTSSNNILTYGLRVNTAGDSNALAVMGNGSVGIGTSSPNAKLEVITSTAGYASIIRNTNGANDSNGLLVKAGTGATEYALKVSNTNDTTNFMVVKGNGNVGIGVTSPGQKLEVAGRIRVTTDPTIEFYESSNKRGGIQWSTANDYTNIFAVGGDIRFDIGGEKMRITSGGNLLLGITNEASQPTTKNFFIADYQSGASITVGGHSGTHTAVLFRHNGATTPGSIVITTSTTTYNTSSDYRLKEDLQDFNGLDKVSKIPVYDFKWKTDESRSYGVMAHELQEVLPDAVVGEKDAEEMQGVDYSKIVPLLVKAIQELEARVKELENN